MCMLTTGLNPQKTEGHYAIIFVIDLTAVPFGRNHGRKYLQRRSGTPRFGTEQASPYLMNIPPTS